MGFCNRSGIGIKMVGIKDYNSGVLPNWCQGCGNYAIWTALKTALVELGVEPWQAVVVLGIGCHGHLANFLRLNSFGGLHGRPVPVAVGIKLANPRLSVMVATGDGDCFGEGGNHFIHAARGNHDLTVIVHDNQVYGLTTGQTSPTSERGYQSKSTPSGVIEEPVNPIALALVSGATYVARAFSGDIKQLTELVKGAITHQGFAVVDVLQPCVSFNKLNTFKFFYDRVYKLEEDSYQPGNRVEAINRSFEWGGPRSAGGQGIPTGLFYQEEKPAYHEQVGVLREKTLVSRPIEPVDITSLMSQLS